MCWSNEYKISLYSLSFKMNNDKATRLYDRNVRLSWLVFEINEFMPINTLTDIELVINRLLKLKALS